MGMKPRKSPARSPLQALYDQVHGYALSLPGAEEHFPWGESVAKVKGKVFVFLGRGSQIEDSWGFSVKLPESGNQILTMPFASPTGYGLGKSGWVSISIPADEILPFDMLRSFVEESYRAVAPAKLAATLGA